MLHTARDGRAVDPDLVGCEDAAAAGGELIENILLLGRERVRRNFGDAVHGAGLSLVVGVGMVVAVPSLARIRFALHPAVIKLVRARPEITHTDFVRVSRAHCNMTLLGVMLQCRPGTVQKAVSVTVPGQQRTMSGRE